ncbi:MAG: hypothetical protein OEU36_10920 [Gammaproteobacteria bacterium]|nr:hypothetical protein [Gammaproteobacteria bacterium]
MHKYRHASGQLVVFALLLLCSAIAVQAHMDYRGATIDIEFVSDNGQVLRQFPIGTSAEEYRAYLEAINGQNYSIRVHNRTGQRIGLVMAVDGHNIISGQKSYLKPSEPMYILDPYSYGSYGGWRTSEKQVHRFYFTDEKSSYAGLFGDFSAMGVAAVAVYPEKQAQPYSKQEEEQSLAADAAPESRARESLSKPGTGFGEEQWSPTVRVDFLPQSQPVAKYFVKYEWHESLCRKAVIECDQTTNRFWPEDRTQSKFVPFPPVIW